MRAMGGTMAHHVAEKVRIGYHNEINLATSKKYPMAVNSQHIMERTITTDVQTITLLLLVSFV